jgi:hypothetical protein
LKEESAMAAAGFSESIWHFLGYLHIADTVARAEKIHDGGSTQTITIDLIATVPPPSRFPTDVEDIASRAIGIQMDALSEELIERRGTFRDFDEADDIEILAAQARSAAAALPSIMRPGFSNAGGAASERVIRVEYDDEAQQTLDSVLQLNRMVDNDVVTSGDIAILTPRGWSESFAAVDAQDALNDLVRDAEAMTPGPLAIAVSGDTAEIVASIKQRDDARAAADEAPAHAVAHGRYVDGALSDEELTPAAPAPEIVGTPASAWTTEDGVTSRTITGPSDGIGAAAYTGGNELTNAAGIRDLSGMSASIVIEGDAFLSNAIIQINILVDNDQVDLAVEHGPDLLVAELMRSATADGNVAHNIAEFAHYSYSDVLRGAAFTPAWTVDVVDGDFFSVRALTQINYLTDNDCVSQSTESTFYQLRTGENQQVNLANIYGFDLYDVVIIGGDSHRVNWIFQKNIILDDDWVTSLLTNGDGGSQEVSAGGNSLVNEARISTYGNDGYSEIGAAQRDLIAALEREDGVLSPNREWQLAGSASGTLKVLYITGDCYDINLISQTNVICDVDQVAQSVAGAGAVAGVVSGANAAGNYAEIADAGTLSGSAFLGGEAYEDSILVQANIVTDQNQIVIHDSGAYASELIAFTGDQMDCSVENLVGPARSCDPNQYDNPGQVMG